MGFRSTFTTSDYSIHWPAWFTEKYAGKIHFTPGHTGTLSAVVEAKTYYTWESLEQDIQRAIDWSDFRQAFILVYLHECGGITRCQIDKDKIQWSEPGGWRKTEGVTHNYCYGCSDVEVSTKQPRQGHS